MQIPLINEHLFQKKFCPSVFRFGYKRPKCKNLFKKNFFFIIFHSLAFCFFSNASLLMDVVILVFFLQINVLQFGLYHFLLFFSYVHFTLKKKVLLLLDVIVLVDSCDFQQKVVLFNDRLSVIKGI